MEKDGPLLWSGPGRPLLTPPQHVQSLQGAVPGWEPRGTDDWRRSSHLGIFGSHPRSSGGHASSIPRSVVMTPRALRLPRRALDPPAPPSVSCPLLSRLRQTPQCCSQVPGGVLRAKGPQVDTEAGPSPGAPALFGQQWGWAVVAAPHGKAHTR